MHSIGFDENDIKQITIKVSNQKDLFPKLSNIFKQNSNEFNEEFLKALDNNKIKINEEELKKIFRSYRKQNEIDFFIHKNAKAFLEEQFDLWMFNHLYKDSQIQQWNPNAIKRMQEVRNIAYEIIYFIAKFEDELKAIWLKPKFAKNTEYVFSLDIIINKAKDSKKLLDLIFKDKNFKNQIKEWKELNLIDENFNISSLQSKIEEIEKYKFIPIDTKHLSREVKFELLSSFENLEELLNGELIKSDNFQALNTIMPKYQGKIDLIYIDPPYNTGNDDFIYTDKFNHTSWLSMINNRLELGKYILNNSGSIFVNIDDNEQANLRLLIDNIFGEENFVSNIIWRKRAGGGNDSKYIAVEQDYIFFYAKNIDLLVTNGIKRTNIKKYKQDDKGYYLEKPLNETSLQDSAGLHYDIRLPNGKILKGNEHQWKMAKSTFLSRLERDEIIFKSNDKVYYKHYIDINSNLVPSSIWYDLALNADATKDIKNLFGYKNFDTPKPEKLLKRILDITSKENSIILDFFAGSGTTCAVALKLGRKFLGVEMGEHFYKVIIPRLKKL